MVAEICDRLTIMPGAVITIGFSQGAQDGLEVAVRYPNEFAGSIVLSPNIKPNLDAALVSPLLAKCGFIVSCGANEGLGILIGTGTDAKWLQDAKAKVIHRTLRDFGVHTFPSDFEESSPEWVRFVLNASAE